MVRITGHDGKRSLAAIPPLVVAAQWTPDRSAYQPELPTTHRPTPPLLVVSIADAKASLAAPHLALCAVPILAADGVSLTSMGNAFAEQTEDRSASSPATTREVGAKKKTE